VYVHAQMHALMHLCLYESEDEELHGQTQNSWSQSMVRWRLFVS